MPHIIFVFAVYMKSQCLYLLLILPQKPTTKKLIIFNPLLLAICKKDHKICYKS